MPRRTYDGKRKITDLPHSEFKTPSQKLILTRAKRHLLLRQLRSKESHIKEKLSRSLLKNPQVISTPISGVTTRRDALKKQPDNLPCTGSYQNQYDTRPQVAKDCPEIMKVEAKVLANKRKSAFPQKQVLKSSDLEENVSENDGDSMSSDPGSSSRTNGTSIVSENDLDDASTQDSNDMEGDNGSLKIYEDCSDGSIRIKQEPIDDMSNGKRTFRYAKLKKKAVILREKIRKRRSKLKQVRRCGSPDYSLADFIRHKEENGNISDGEFGEILECPSPVWWEDPGSDEDYNPPKKKATSTTKTTGNTSEEPITSTSNTTVNQDKPDAEPLVIPKVPDLLRKASSLDNLLMKIKARRSNSVHLNMNSVKVNKGIINPTNSRSLLKDVLFFDSDNVSMSSEIGGSKRIAAVNEEVISEGIKINSQETSSCSKEDCTTDINKTDEKAANNNNNNLDDLDEILSSTKIFKNDKQSLFENKANNKSFVTLRLNENMSQNSTSFVKVKEILRIPSNDVPLPSAVDLNNKDKHNMENRIPKIKVATTGCIFKLQVKKPKYFHGSFSATDIPFVQERPILDVAATSDPQTSSNTAVPVIRDETRSRPVVTALSDLKTSSNTAVPFVQRNIKFDTATNNNLNASTNTDVFSVKENSRLAMEATNNTKASSKSVVPFVRANSRLDIATTNNFNASSSTAVPFVQERTNLATTHNPNTTSNTSVPFKQEKSVLYKTATFNLKPEQTKAVKVYSGIDSAEIIPNLQPINKLDASTVEHIKNNIGSIVNTLKDEKANISPNLDDGTLSESSEKCDFVIDLCDRSSEGDLIDLEGEAILKDIEYMELPTDEDCIIVEDEKNPKENEAFDNQNAISDFLDNFDTVVKEYETLTTGNTIAERQNNEKKSCKESRNKEIFNLDDDEKTSTNLIKRKNESNITNNPKKLKYDNNNASTEDTGNSKENVYNLCKDSIDNDATAAKEKERYFIYVKKINKDKNIEDGINETGVVNDDPNNISENLQTDNLQNNLQSNNDSIQRTEEFVFLRPCEKFNSKRNTKLINAENKDFKELIEKHVYSMDASEKNKEHYLKNINTAKLVQDNKDSTNRKYDQEISIFKGMERQEENRYSTECKPDQATPYVNSAEKQEETRNNTEKKSYQDNISNVEKAERREENRHGTKIVDQAISDVKNSEGKEETRNTTDKEWSNANITERKEENSNKTKGNEMDSEIKETYLVNDEDENIRLSEIKRISVANKYPLENNMEANNYCVHNKEEFVFLRPSNKFHSKINIKLNNAENTITTVPKELIERDFNLTDVPEKSKEVQICTEDPIMLKEHFLKNISKPQLVQDTPNIKIFEKEKGNRNNSKDKFDKDMANAKITEKKEENSNRTKGKFDKDMSNSDIIEIKEENVITTKAISDKDMLNSDINKIKEENIISTQVKSDKNMPNSIINKIKEENVITTKVISDKDMLNSDINKRKEENIISTQVKSDKNMPNSIFNEIKEENVITTKVISDKDMLNFDINKRKEENIISNQVKSDKDMTIGKVTNRKEENINMSNSDINESKEGIKNSSKDKSTKDMSNPNITDRKQENRNKAKGKFDKDMLIGKISERKKESITGNKVLKITLNKIRENINASKRDKKENKILNKKVAQITTTTNYKANDKTPKTLCTGKRQDITGQKTISKNHLETTKSLISKEMIENIIGIRNTDEIASDSETLEQIIFHGVIPKTVVKEEKQCVLTCNTTTAKKGVCKHCYPSEEQTIIVEKANVKYCFKCSSIYDTDGCSYCLMPQTDDLTGNRRIMNARINKEYKARRLTGTNKMPDNNEMID